MSSNARTLVTNDSGAMHVAAALGVPITAIFGPTRENETAPVSQQPMPAPVTAFWSTRVVPALHAARVSARSCMHARRGADGCARRRQADSLMQASAVFLDRDGTLIEEVGYLDRVERVELYPWTIAAVRAFNHAQLRIVLVSISPASRAGSSRKR